MCAHLKIIGIHTTLTPPIEKFYREVTWPAMPGMPGSLLPEAPPISQVNEPVESEIAPQIPRVQDSKPHPHLPLFIQ